MFRPVRTVSWALLALSLVGNVALPGQGQAGDPKGGQGGDAAVVRARALFSAAEKDEAAGSFEVALSKFREVATIRNSPAVRFHVAYCEEKLANLRSALAGYADASAAAEREGNAEVRAAADAAGRLLSARMPRLVLSLPKGRAVTSVFVDSVEVTAADRELPVLLDPGPHTVRVTAIGAPPFVRSVTVTEHETTVVPVDFLGPSAMTPAVALSTKKPEASRTVIVPLVLAAGGVALAAGGAVAHAIAGNQRDEAVVACAERTDPCDAERGRVRTLDGVAAAAFVGAIALEGVAAFVWFQAGSKGGAPKSARVLHQGGRLLLGGEF
jgi:hypothetical protein